MNHGLMPLLFGPGFNLIPLNFVNPISSDNNSLASVGRKSERVLHFQRDIMRLAGPLFSAFLAISCRIYFIAMRKL